MLPIDPELKFSKYVLKMCPESGPPRCPKTYTKPHVYFTRYTPCEKKVLKMSDYRTS